MSGYIVFETEKEFDQWHAQVNEALGLPDKTTERYTYAIEGEDGRWYAAINRRCPQHLLLQTPKQMTRDVASGKVSKFDSVTVRK